MLHLTLACVHCREIQVFFFLRSEKKGSQLKPCSVNDSIVSVKRTSKQNVLQAMFEALGSSMYLVIE